MAENKWICPACGQENDGKFCIGCGAPATVDAPAPAEAAEAPSPAEAAPAAEAAIEAEPAEAAQAKEVQTIEVPAEPSYDTTPVDEITEPVMAPVSADSVTPAYAPAEDVKVDPDDYVPAEPDHSAPAPSAAQTPVSPDYSDPDNFVPAPMHPEKQGGSNGSYKAPSSSAAPKPAGYTPALVGLILSIAGIVLLWVPVLGIGLSIAGLVLAIVAKKKGYAGGMGTAALIISIIAIALSVIGTVSCIACIALNS